ncbi:MAG: TonB-dependent receptor [Pseudohongiella sp.]|nr:TonB-dependent receptor [Pseudohongiella sp.]MDO9519206.1 TonB-dependent receptor [Pseudohongiella sp.]
MTDTQYYGQRAHARTKFTRSVFQPAPLSKISALSIAICVALGSLSQNALAQQSTPEVEEVVVTGSYIRRSEGFIAASPVTQITAEDLEAEGTVNMGQVVQNLTFNSGSAITGGIQGSTDQSTTVNLRGLGERATLSLLDGKRVPTENIIAMIPSIAIQRMEIVTDGAAALYGTDAVAGVVNLIPYKSFDGARAEYYHEGDDRGDFYDRQFSFIGGKKLGTSVEIVGAIQHRDTGELRWDERPEHLLAGLSQNSGGNPGNHRVPVRNATGDLTGALATRPDPSCQRVTEDPSIRGSNAFGVSLLGRCWLDFGDTFNYRNPQNLTNYYGNISYDVNPDLVLSAQITHAAQIRNSRQAQSYPGGRVTELPVVRGELPGNPFRARTSSGQDLFAVPLRDAGGNIVTDAYGQPLPLRGSTGQVVLAPNRFASINGDPLGGVPFNEDVLLEAWVPIGKANTMPVQNNDDTSAANETNRYSSRLAFTADFAVPRLQGWEGTAFYTYSRDLNTDRMNQHYSFSAIKQGLSCDVINDADACFNPFGAVDPRFLNSQAVADSIVTQHRQRLLDELQTFDVVLNGTIPLGNFTLPGGEVGAAVGVQRRDESLDYTPALGIVTGDVFIGVQQNPRTDSRFVNAVFAEFLLPVLDNVQISAAIRNENFSTGQEELIQKYGAVYAPADWLSLRASWGEAFIVPTMSQLGAPQSCGLSNVDDPFTNFQGFLSSCLQGNPDLFSETSESLAIGFDLSPFDGLSMSLTWSETDFKDRIVGTTTQDIMRSDYFNFQQATGYSGAQKQVPIDLLTSWTNDPRSDRRIVRDPANVTRIERLIQSDSNASTMKVQAWDLNLDYALPFDRWGGFDVNLQGTYLETYQFQVSPRDPVREATGNQNSSFGAVPAMPRLRANARLNWRMNDHSASITVRHISALTFDANQFAFQVGFPFSNFRSTTEIRAWTQADMFYTYRGLEVPGMTGDLSLTAGMRNMFDREAQKTGMIAGVVTELQDPLGRVIYGRVSYSF